MDGWVRERWGDGAIAWVTRRTKLTNGFSSPNVERLDLRVTRPYARPALAAVLRKTANQAEVSALRALQEVRDATTFPELLATGEDENGPWVLTPFYTGIPALNEPAIPVEVVESLARLHAHYSDVALEDVPRLDQARWRQKCEFAIERLPQFIPADPLRDQTLELLREYAIDPTLARTLQALPHTLVHGDVHANNVLVNGPYSMLIDWGGVYLAPAMLDLANLTTPGTEKFQRYKQSWQDATGSPLDEELATLGFHWATVAVNVKYLVFAAKNLGIGAVGAMVDRACTAKAKLEAQLRK
ncbi:phosphotransferase family protein [Flindersiella endophytica]